MCERKRERERERERERDRVDFESRFRSQVHPIQIVFPRTVFLQPYHDDGTTTGVASSLSQPDLGRSMERWKATTKPSNKNFFCYKIYFCIQGKGPEKIPEVSWLQFESLFWRSRVQKLPGPPFRHSEKVYLKLKCFKNYFHLNGSNMFCDCLKTC